MNLVIDANILFSSLIKKGTTEDLVFNDELYLFAPEFIFEEFAKYKDYLLGKTHRTESEFEEILSILKRRINVVSSEEIKIYLAEANLISPDKKDSDYFALALKLDAPIWSNDKELKNQSRVKVYSTIELYELLGFP